MAKTKRAQRRCQTPTMLPSRRHDTFHPAQTVILSEAKNPPHFAFASAFASAFAFAFAFVSVFASLSTFPLPLRRAMLQTYASAMPTVA
jgi:hypothetical protein